MATLTFALPMTRAACRGVARRTAVRSTAPRRRAPRRRAARAASAPRPRSRLPSRWRRATRRACRRRRRRSRRRRRRRGSRCRSLAQLRQVLARQREHARAVLALQRELPALQRLHRVAGAEHEQVRDRAQRRQMLDRLVRRAVFAEADRVVRHHVDDALAHQRGEPDRRAAIIGEHQERAGIRNDAAMQRHAVHRRRHAVLADAVVDVAAARSRRPTSPSCPWRACCSSR